MLTTKQAAYATKLIGWIAEKDEVTAESFRVRLANGSAGRGFVDELIEANNAAKSQARKAERQSAAATLAAATPEVVTFTGRVIETEWQTFGYNTTEKLVVDGSAIGVERVFVTFPAKLSKAHGDALRSALRHEEEVVVTVSGKVKFHSARSASVTKAKGHELAVLASELPLDELVSTAVRAWELLMSTEVVGERTVKCCGGHMYGAQHTGPGSCNCTVQVMSDVWDSCGCKAKPGERETTVVGSDIASEPVPGPVALAVWFEALTPAQQRLGSLKMGGYGMGSGYSVASSALAGLAKPETDYNNHARHWEQLAYLGH